MKRQLAIQNPLERSNSVKLKVPHKIFPQDFFALSNSPTKKNQQTKVVDSSIKKRNFSIQSSKSKSKNHQNIGMMKEQINKCQDEKRRDSLLPIQRMLIKSEQKQRSNVVTGNNSQSLRNIKKRKSFMEMKDKNLEDVNQVNCKMSEVEVGLFTFFGKIPKSVKNIRLPPLF